MQELQIIQSKLKAPKGQTNKFGGYKYRNAEDILEALKPLLEEQKAVITLSDKLIQLGERYYVEATASITCPSGEVSVTAYAREAQTKKGMDEAQITGSASSYARKYAMNGLLAIDDTKDPDNHDNSKEGASSKKESSPQPNVSIEHVGRDPEATAQQFENINELAKKAKVTLDQVDSKIASMKFKGTDGLKTKLKELNKAEAATIIGQLTAKLQEGNK